MRIMFEAASERDPNKRREIACDFSKFLVQPDGLANLFLALIDFDTSSQKTTTHNQRFLAVANIIGYLPKLCLPYAEYCESLRRQLTPMLVHSDTRYSSLASLIVKGLLESPHANKTPQQVHLVQQVLLGPLLEPLTRKIEALDPEHTVLIVHNLIQNRLPSRLFVGTFPSLFYALVTLNSTPSQLKTYLKSIIICILNDLKPGPACCLLEQAIFHQTGHNVYTVVIDEDQVTLELDNGTKQEPDLGALKLVVLELLEQCDSELILLEFFFYFQAKMLLSNDGDTSSQCAALIEPLLEQTIQETSKNNKLDLLTSILSNSRRALRLISRSLVNYLEFLRMSKATREQDVSESRVLVNQSLSNCLDILEVLLATQENVTQQDRIANTLREIKKLVTQDGQECKGKLELALDSLIHKLDSGLGQFQVPKVGDLASRDYDEAVRDLNDRLVPVRVHALVRLKNLLLAGDQYTVARISQLYAMIECSLADQEPYVFLASINLMAEMGLRRTAELLPRLMELYAKQELAVEQRLNVGEVLVRLTRRMHEMTPAYAQEIMQTFLEATASDDELVRMSSLANMGEICGNLGHSLSRYIVDILLCVERILKIDTVETKCAAVGLLRSTLMGLDRLSIESVQREIKSIYNLLKGLRQRTLDERLCLQADLALDEIDRLARDLLGLNNEKASSSANGLVKNLKILSLLE